MTLNDQLVSKVSTTSPMKDTTEAYDAAHGRYQPAQVYVKAAGAKRAAICCNPFASMSRR